MNPLEDLRESIARWDEERLHAALNQAKEKNMKRATVRNALLAGLDKARMAMGTHMGSVPEFLLCVDLMQTGLERLGEFPGNDDDKPGPCVVIGVAEGDVHDLGKNIVAAVLRSCQMEVKDLGRSAAPQQFVDAAQENKAAVVAISTMMTTTLEAVRQTVALCRQQIPATSVMLGGAALDASLAQELGADSYAENAKEVPQALAKAMPRTFMDFARRLRVVETGHDA